ncbi:nucleoside 2-deoxyribosyltransferase [Tamilnaduibacter salinus]|uniref:Nucleoside 2-deoxyribosyltransferase n=1 Tax=Tamilnaduibacter salinus TaxID=1484056 RepID=A0A2U1CTF7_9GAMM|nr:nucleoside 2-deoxyribosyltransferase [Tamilnaduibacter salinus]PVY69990.1 nucleoside 2-deoxyribosyltransferase [Tamilnaduibacter salinus]
MATVYLAGPEVFFDTATRESITQQKKALLNRFGLEGLAPTDNDPELSGTDGEQAATIYQSNRALMGRCDAIIANLTPFRGPSADAGTIFEVGYMIARGRAAAGFTVCSTPYHDRVRRGETTDDNGAAIEPFGLGDNLMIDCGLIARGGDLFRGSRPYEPGGFRPSESFDRDAFGQAVESIRAQLSRQTHERLTGRATPGHPADT